MTHALELRLPLTNEQAALVADLERELRLRVCLSRRIDENRVVGIDQRRFRKVLRREQDAIIVRTAAIETRLLELEQRKLP